MNVNFESKGEKKRRERRERKREMWGNPEDRLRDFREEVVETSLRVGRLEHAMMMVEGSGSRSGSSGSEWAWWNGAWWIRTGSRMNSAGKRRVSRAVHQAMSRQGEQVRNGMNKLMAYLQEAKLENLSDNDRELAFRQATADRRRMEH